MLCSGYFILSVLGLAIVPQPANVMQAALAQQPAAPPLIPSDLNHAAEFVLVLQQAGVVVEQVRPSHFEGFLGGGNKAAFIKTNYDIVELVVFPDKGAAEKLTITYSKSPESSARHRYLVNSTAGKGKPETMDAAYPIYFTLHGNWLITTLDVELEATIKRALRQTNHAA
jgi:hypothetical protein